MLFQDDENLEDKRRYDDDGLSFYSTNAEVTKELTDVEKEEVIGAQAMNAASTYDLLLELNKRFNHMVFMGKRLITAEPTGVDIDQHRHLPPEVDNRFMIRGDIHTIFGLNFEMNEHIKYGMECGESYLNFGFGGMGHDFENETEDEEDD